MPTVPRTPRHPLLQHADPRAEAAHDELQRRRAGYAAEDYRGSPVVQGGDQTNVGEVHGVSAPVMGALTGRQPSDSPLGGYSPDTNEIFVRPAGLNSGDGDTLRHELRHRGLDPIIPHVLQDLPNVTVDLGPGQRRLTLADPARGIFEEELLVRLFDYWDAVARAPDEVRGVVEGIMRQTRLSEATVRELAASPKVTGLLMYLQKAAQTDLQRAGRMTGGVADPVHYPSMETLRALMTGEIDPRRARMPEEPEEPGFFERLGRGLRTVLGADK